MTFKLIHVGLGGWGSDWEKTALHAIRDQVTVAGIVEAFDATRERAMATFGYREDQAFASLAEALEAVEADAVLLTSPMETHAPLAIEAMRAGKHVLVEKPLAGSVAEAREAIAVAEETGMVLQVSQNYRFYPAARKAAQLVKERALGDLGTINIDFRKYDNDADPATHRHYRYQHALLFDMSIHHFDLMRLILDAEPQKIYVQQTDPHWSKYADEASATVIVTFEDGTIVSYRGSWISSEEPTTWTGEWVMECERGSIRWHGREGGPSGTDGDAVTIRTRDGKVKPVTLDPMPVWGRSAGVLHFVESIRAGVEPETSARRNLGSVALMEAAATSLTSGQAAPVEAVLP